MKQQLNEEFRRMQKLAGIQFNEDIDQLRIAPEVEKNVENGLKNVLSTLKVSASTIKPSFKDKTLKEIEPVSFTVGLIASAPGLLELLGKAVDGISKPFLKAGQSGTVVGKALAKAGHRLEDEYLKGIAAILKKAFPQSFSMEYQENNELGKAAKKIYMGILIAAGINAGMSAASAHSIISKVIEGGAAVLKAAEAVELAAAIV